MRPPPNDSLSPANLQTPATAAEFVWPAALGAASIAIAFVAIGPSLNVYLSLLAFAAIACPPMTLRTGSPRQSWISVAILAIEGLVACLVVAALTHLGMLPALRCWAVLSSFIFAIAAAAQLAHSCRLPPVPAGAACTAIALAWLTAPLWALRVSHPAIIDVLVKIHPLFAINSAAIQLGIWTEQPLTYQLTTLGQDVPYALPASVLPCVGLHAIAGAVMVVTSIVVMNVGRPHPKQRPRVKN